MKFTLLGSIGFILSLNTVLAASACNCDASDTSCIKKCGKLKQTSSGKSISTFTVVKFSRRYK